MASQLVTTAGLASPGTVVQFSLAGPVISGRGATANMTVLLYERFRTNYGGGYKLAGSTTANGVPYAAQVYVFPQDNPSLCVASATTEVAASGVFSITGLLSGNYIVVAVDPTGTYNDITFDFVASVPM